MKPIKHMRSKRGFYIGRVRQISSHIQKAKVSPDYEGITGKGMSFSSFLMTLAGQQPGTKVIDPKTDIRQMKCKLQQS